MHSVKTPVVQRQNYVMYLEFFADMHWFHTDVFKWNKEVKKQFLEDLNLLQYLVSTPLVALIEEDNTKLAKFAQKIGFKVEQPFTGSDNEQYYIWSRSI